MADSKITALTALTAADPTNDMIPIVDVSDTPPASGNTKRISINNILSSSPTASGALTVTGLVTAGSATITGALTVDASTLVIDSINNRVIVGHTSGSAAFQVTNAGAAGLEILPTGVNSAPVILSYNRSSSAYTQLTIDASTIVHSLSGTTAMTLNATGLAIANGNVILSTSGKGIDFSATANGSGTMTSELLNDYEEGTWTGTLTGSTTNPTVAVTATGRYTKIGRVVTVQISYSNATTTGASGAIAITGLPFANNSAAQSNGSVSLYQIGTFTGSPFAIIDGAASSIDIQSNISGATYGSVTHNAGVARYMTTSITYTVA